jgi:CheY-like chemotaxis protein
MPTTTKHILLVDDETAVRELLVEVFSGAGYRVSEAPSPALALQMIRAEQPDLVITDLQMDEIDGFEFIDTLHASAPKLPIILLTGVMFDAGAIEKTLSGKISCYLEKTSSLQEILSKVRHHIGGG